MSTDLRRFIAVGESFADAEGCPRCGYADGDHARGCPSSEDYFDEVASNAVALYEERGVAGGIAKARELEDLARGTITGDFWRDVAESIEDATKDPNPLP